MYGIIHHGLFRMISQRLGEEIWNNLCVKSGMDPVSSVISTQAYPDEQTYALLSGCAEALHLSLADFLELFGREWIKTGFEIYGGILRRCGRDLETVIRNLNIMHVAIVHALPHARIGSFEVLQSDPTSLVVMYKAKREDISPFLIGLLKGLLDHFDRAGSVELISGTNEDMRFLISYEQS